MTASRLVFAYTAFAILATITNILTQEASVRLYQGTWSIPLSIAAGTATGLALKYQLDKHYIFRFRTSGLAHDTRTFMLYAVMGLATTAIFWAFEFGFHLMFASKEMRYAGGVIGLAIGYLTKYQLDKRLVFLPQ